MWFATILALRGRVTGRNLSRSCDDSERTSAGQFRGAFNWPDFHQRVLTAALDPCSELSSVQEAAFMPQSGKPTFGLGPFFNGGASRAERGLEISTLAVGDMTRRCAFTLALAQPPPGEGEATSPQGEDETRVAFYKQQLRDQPQRVPQRVPHPCVDGYFAKKKSIDEVVALKLPPITKLRYDANCWVLYPGPHPKRRGPRRKYDGKVPFQDLRRFEDLGPLEERDHVQLYTALVWHASLKRQRRGVVLVNRKAPPKPRSIVWASTELQLNGRRLAELYGARVQLEFLFRDSNQVTGVSDGQARAEAALDFHFTASLAPLTRVRAEALRASPPHSSQVCSLASWQQPHCTERLLDLFEACA